MPVSQATCTTTKVRVCDGKKGAFANWQAKFHEAIVASPGFVSLEILSPNSLNSCEWGVVERFADEETLEQWHSSEVRRTLFEELRTLADGQGISEAPFEIGKSQGNVTEVFVTEVLPEKEKVYREWISKMHKVEAKFPGFLGVYVQSPSGEGRNWITLLQFDTPENLDRWLASEERQKVLEESESMILALDSHRMISPFGGWFSSVSKGVKAPPAWKQAMIVLLVLFPIVMLEMKFLSPLTAGLNPSLAMFIGNVISVGLLAWPMVPWTIKLLNWWLMPAPQNSWRANIFGTLFVIALYIISIAIFWV